MKGKRLALGAFYLGSLFYWLPENPSPTLVAEEMLGNHEPEEEVVESSVASKEEEGSNIILIEDVAKDRHQEEDKS